MQQLCSFVGPEKKIQDKFVMTRETDFQAVTGYSIIGCRIVMLVVAGRLDISINGRTYSLGKNTFVDILEGTRVEFTDRSADLEVYCIFTIRDFLMEVLQNIIPGPKNYLFKIMMNPVVALNDKSCAVMLTQMKLLDGSLADLGHFHREEMIRIYLRGLVLELGNILINEYKWQMPDQSLNKRELLMANFMDLVWKNFRENREISFYARELCVSSKHLSRMVKEASGRTPHEIIAREVMALSMQLLKDKNILIQQISDVLHFSDQAAFSKFFKKYMKMSPVEYRKSHWENV